MKNKAISFIFSVKSIPPLSLRFEHFSKSVRIFPTISKTEPGN